MYVEIDMEEIVETRLVPIVAQPLSAQGVNIDVSVTLTASAGQHILANGVLWSYRGDPGTNGRLTIRGHGFDVDVDIPAQGVGCIPLHIPVIANASGQLVITLYAGGAGVVGKLNLLGHAVR